MELDHTMNNDNNINNDNMTTAAVANNNNNNNITLMAQSQTNTILKSSYDIDVVRLIGQHLINLGLKQTANLLLEESGLHQFDHPIAIKFKEHILLGEWDKASQLVEDVANLSVFISSSSSASNVTNSNQSAAAAAAAAASTSNSMQVKQQNGCHSATTTTTSPIMNSDLEQQRRTNISAMRLAIAEQKFLELIEDNDRIKALRCLRCEITPICKDANRIQFLTTLLMCKSIDEIRLRSQWPGKSQLSRQAFFNKMTYFIPPIFMLPPKRLETLLNQAVQLQRERCVLHLRKLKLSNHYNSIISQQQQLSTLHNHNNHCNNNTNNHNQQQQQQSSTSTETIRRLVATTIPSRFSKRNNVSTIISNQGYLGCSGYCSRLEQRHKRKPRILTGTTRVAPLSAAAAAAAAASSSSSSAAAAATSRGSRISRQLLDINMMSPLANIGSNDSNLQDSSDFDDNNENFDNVVTDNNDDNDNNENNAAQFNGIDFINQNDDENDDGDEGDDDDDDDDDDYEDDYYYNDNYNDHHYVDLKSDHICLADRFPLRTRQLLQSHKNEVWYCKFSNDGTKLATGGLGGKIKIWNLDNNNNNKRELVEKCTLDCNSLSISCLSWSPNDVYLLACGSDDQPDLWVWNVQTEQMHQMIHRLDDESFTTCSWHLSGERFVAASIKGTFNIYDLNGNKCGSREGVRIQSVSFLNKNPNLVLAADTLNRIKAYKIKHNQTSDVLTLNSEEDEILWERYSITTFVVDKQDKYIAVNIMEQGVHLWDLNRRSLLRVFLGVSQRNLTIYSSFSSPDSTFLASGSEDGQIYIYHICRDEPVAILNGHDRCVNCVTWNPKFPELLASVSDDRSVRLWAPAEPGQSYHVCHLLSQTGQFNQSMQVHLQSPLSVLESIRQHNYVAFATQTPPAQTQQQQQQQQSSSASSSSASQSQSMAC